MKDENRAKNVIQFSLTGKSGFSENSYIRMKKNEWNDSKR